MALWLVSNRDLPPPPGRERALGDKLQWLAYARPEVLATVERLIDRYLDRFRDRPDNP